MPEPVYSEAMQQIVSRALNTEKGIRIEFPTNGAAVNFRQRYYKVRARLLKQHPDSDWRNLSCVIEGNFLLFIPTDAQVLHYKIEEIE